MFQQARPKLIWTYWTYKGLFKPLCMGGWRISANWIYALTPLSTQIHHSKYVEVEPNSHRIVKTCVNLDEIPQIFQSMKRCHGLRLLKSQIFLKCLSQIPNSTLCRRMFILEKAKVYDCINALWKCIMAAMFILSLFCLKLSFKTKFTLRAGGQLSALLSWDVELRPKVQDQIYYENLGDEVIVNTRIRSTCTLMHQIKYNGFLELFWLCFPQPSKPSTPFFHETLISPMIKGTCTLKITCTHHHQTWLPSTAIKCLPNEKILKNSSYWN